MRRKIVLRLLIFLTGFCAVVYVAAYLFQDRIIFQTVKLTRTDPFTFEYPFEEFFIPVGPTDTLNALWFKPDSLHGEPAEPSKGLILYFHGNRGNLQRWGNYAPAFTQHGFDVLMIDYRGYGKSTGSPSEENIYADARQAYAWALNHKPEGELIIYGRSLGSAAASRLAMEIQPKLLILETPFDELSGAIPQAWQFLVPILPLRYTMSNVDHVSKVKGRVVIFHGTNDRIVPLNAALKLRPYVQDHDFVIIEGGGHRNLGRTEAYQNKISELLGNL